MFFPVPSHSTPFPHLECSAVAVGWEVDGGGRFQPYATNSAEACEEGREEGRRLGEARDNGAEIAWEWARMGGYL